MYEVHLHGINHELLQTTGKKTSGLDCSTMQNLA